MRHSGYTFEFLREEVVALLEFASQDETRVNLNCIGLDTARGEAMATDGHTAIQLRNNGPIPEKDAPTKTRAQVQQERLKAQVTPTTDKPAFVPRTMRSIPLGPFERAVKLCRNGEFVVVEALLDKYVFFVGNGTEEGKPYDGNFPTMDQVIPPLLPRGKTPLVQHMGFNVEYLARLVVVVKAVIAAKLAYDEGGIKPAKWYPTRGVVIQWGASDLDPIRVDAGQWVVIVMPMRL